MAFGDLGNLTPAPHIDLKLGAVVRGSPLPGSHRPDFRLSIKADCGKEAQSLVAIRL
jgi:hypothetical protein